jgi:hypothetical protein
MSNKWINFYGIRLQRESEAIPPFLRIHSKSPLIWRIKPRANLMEFVLPEPNKPCTITQNCLKDNTAYLIDSRSLGTHSTLAPAATNQLGIERGTRWTNDWNDSRAILTGEIIDWKYSDTQQEEQDHLKYNGRLNLQVESFEVYFPQAIYFEFLRQPNVETRE